MTNFKPINPKKRIWLENLRKEKNLSQRELAPLIGDLSWNHYADIEAGRRNPSIELSYKLADFFNVKIDVFLTERTKFKAEENIYK